MKFSGVTQIWEMKQWAKFHQIWGHHGLGHLLNWHGITQKANNSHGVTLLLHTFVTAPVTLLCQITEWKTLMFKWALIWKHDRIDIILLMNILDGWIIRIPRQFLGVAVTNTFNIMDENILKCSWSKNSLVFRLAIELSNMFVLCLLHQQTWLLHFGCTCIK